MTVLTIVVLAGLGTAHILVRTATYGAGVNADSITFISTALNFLAGEGWRDFTGRPMVTWPPLFPLLLAAFGWIGIDPLEAGRWINATAFGLTILAAGSWLRSNLRSRWLALAASVASVVSLPLSHFASNFMTDSLFVLLTLLALIQLASFLNRRTAAPLWWAAVFTALAALTRYPGVVLIGTGVLVLLLTAQRKQTLIFGAISSVPLLAVLAHNWVATGNLFQAAGYRPTSSGQSLSDGLGQTVEVFRSWVVPPNAPDGLAYLLGLAVATVVLLSRRYAPEAASAYLRLGPVLPFAGFAVAYLVFLIVVVPFTVKQGVDSRYLLPIYVPLLLTAVFLLDRFLSIKAVGRMAAGRYIVASLVGLATLAHVGYSARENLRVTAQARLAGNDYWQQSETLNYLQDNHIEGRIYSDMIPLVWLADYIAGRTYTSKESPVWLARYERIPNRMRWTQIEAGAHIVWFERDYRPQLHCDTVDLRVLSGVETVAELADGLVLRRTAYEPFDAKRHLDWIGFRLGDQWIAIAQLPDYAIGRIHIGQWIAEEDRTLWEAEFPTSR